jgi:putative effector of murein hydrolase
LFWLAVTLTVFAGADALSLRSRRHPCATVLLATPALVVLIRLSGVTYATCSGATSVLGFLLGPAVVGLPFQIHARLGLIRRLACRFFLRCWPDR